MKTEPLVSVVIPTHQRSHLVARAVQTALKQTLAEIEVIVVIDGPDEATQRALAQIDDPRLKIVTLASNGGAGVARNTGVNKARAKWVAFLDDDDEWMPQKLEIQLRTAEQSPWRYPIIACRLMTHRGDKDVVVPHRVIGENEPISEYLFCRSGLFWGEGLLQTSTWLPKRRWFASSRSSRCGVERILIGFYARQVSGMCVWNLSSRARRSQFGIPRNMPFRSARLLLGAIQR